MREKVTASIIFKNRKASYPKSVIVPFRGDYVGLRRNPAWKDTLKRNRLHKMDQRVIYADIMNKMNRSNGKVGKNCFHKKIQTRFITNIAY